MIRRTYYNNFMPINLQIWQSRKELKVKKLFNEKKTTTTKQNPHWMIRIAEKAKDRTSKLKTDQ